VRGTLRELSAYRVRGSSPSPRPLRASFARLVPVKNGERENKNHPRGKFAAFCVACTDNRLKNPLRDGGDSRRHFKAIRVVQSPLAKIFRFRRRANQFYQLAPSFPGKRGGSRVVTNAGGDAVDAAASARGSVHRAASVSEQQRAGRTALVAYGKTVWSRHPLLVPSCRWRIRSNRIRSAIKPAATVTRRIRRRGATVK
jgi:hypothetical protein